MPQQAVICMQGTLPGPATGHPSPEWTGLGRTGEGLQRPWGRAVTAKIKQGDLVKAHGFLSGHLACSPPPHTPGLRLPRTYRQNESCERGQLAGVSVDPLLQLQDGARCKRSAPWGVKEEDSALKPLASRTVKEPTPGPFCPVPAKPLPLSRKAPSLSGAVGQANRGPRCHPGEPLSSAPAPTGPSEHTRWIQTELLK